MRSATAFVAIAVAGLAAAQEPTQKYSSEYDMTVDANSVDPGTRIDWCNGQQDTCLNLCDQDTKDNDCDDSDLSWKCTCTKNGSRPGLEFYTQTMPTFICEALYGQCEAKAVTSIDSKNCKDNIRALCGKYTPPSGSGGDDDDGSSSSSTSASAEPTTTGGSGSGSGSGSGGSGGATATDNSATSTSTGLAAPTLAPAGNGMAAVAAMGLFAYLV